MARLVVHLVLCVLTLVTSSVSKRVLFFPSPLTSHTKYHANVATYVGRLGHEVWVCMPPYIRERKIFDEVGYKILEYRSNPANVEELSMSGMRDKYWRGEAEDFSIHFRSLTDHIHKIMSDDGLIQHIRSLQIDLIVLDNIRPWNLMTVLPYKLGIPFAVLGTFCEPLIYRTPFMPHLNPIPVFGHNGINASFVERLTLATVQLLFETIIFTDGGFVAKYAPERPPITMRQLQSSAEIYLAEVDHIIDYPRPTVPNVKFIGGASITEARQLTGELKTFVDQSTKDIVVLCFGSFVHYIPDDIVDKIFNVFKRLDNNAVMKINRTSPVPDKIWTANWIPLNDLLGQPKVKVFVSHCGENGQYEALYYAVPFLCFPFCADQPYNAERSRVKSISLTGDLKTITEDDFVQMIEELGHNPTYRANIQRLSQLFKINQGLPVERAAFWLDHVMTFGGGYMRAAWQGQMPTYQYHGLDVMFVLIVAIIALFGSICLVSYLCIVCVCKRRKLKVHKE